MAEHYPVGTRLKILPDAVGPSCPPLVPGTIATVIRSNSSDFDFIVGDNEVHTGWHWSDLGHYYVLYKKPTVIII